VGVVVKEEAVMVEEEAVVVEEATVLVEAGGGDQQVGTHCVPPVVLQNPVTLQKMEDGIVDPTVYSRYCNKIMTLGTWIHDNEPSWFTEFGMGKYEELQVLQEGKGSGLRRKRIKDEWLAMLRNAKNTPIVHINM
jgi:hypothetical protein